MNEVQAFEKMVELLKIEPEVSIFVKAEVLADMGVNLRHLEEVSRRRIRRRKIVVRGADGLPLDEIEFEFLPVEGVA